jgi:hypothetical protein
MVIKTMIQKDYLQAEAHLSHILKAVILGSVFSFAGSLFSDLCKFPFTPNENLVTFWDVVFQSGIICKPLT